MIDLNSITIEAVLGIFALIFAIITLYYAYKIAHHQDDQLKDLKQIENRTHEITRELKTDKYSQDIVNAFFKFDDSTSRNSYDIYFPIEYYKKPLPLINQGDFFALHVITSRIKEKDFVLKPIVITRTEDSGIDHEHPIHPKPAEAGESVGNNSQEMFDNNCIFLCAPHANPALNAIFPMEIINNDAKYADLMKNNWPISNYDLPCWFVQDSRDTYNGKKWISRKIFIPQTQPLDSPSEKNYQAAFYSPEGTEYKHQEKFQRDLGVLGRITKKDKQYIIIAGIHQYGTWIVAALLSHLFTGEYNGPEKSFLLGNDDFIAIYSGGYDSQKLSINHITNEYIWIKKAPKTWQIIEKDRRESGY
jgi:hypothetical protein